MDEAVVVSTTLSRRDFCHDDRHPIQEEHYIHAKHSPSSPSSSIIVNSLPTSRNASEDGGPSLSSPSSSSLSVMASEVEDDHHHDHPQSRRPIIQEPKSKKLRKKSLGSNYQPGEHAIICGRGKEYSLSTGNCFLRCIVNHCLVPYANASTKAEKSRIVTAIIKAVHTLPTGIFIRFEKNQWWEVDDAFARDKVGSLFRDSLFTKYRSSTKAKMEKKKIRNEEARASSHEQCGELVVDLEDDHDVINLVEPTSGRPFLQNSQQQLSLSETDKSCLVDPRLLSGVISDDDSATISLNSFCFSPTKKNHSQSDEGILMPQMIPKPNCRLFPPPLRQQERMGVPRQVSDGSMTDSTSWKPADRSLSNVNKESVELFPFPVQKNEWITFHEGQDTSLETIISDMDELDSFLANCF